MHETKETNSKAGKIPIDFSERDLYHWIHRLSSLKTAKDTTHLTLNWEKRFDSFNHFKLVNATFYLSKISTLNPNVPKNIKKTISSPNLKLNP